MESMSFPSSPSSSPPPSHNNHKTGKSNMISSSYASSPPASPPMSRSTTPKPPALALLTASTTSLPPLGLAAFPLSPPPSPPSQRKRQSGPLYQQQLQQLQPQQQQQLHQQRQQQLPHPDQNLCNHLSPSPPRHDRSLGGSAAWYAASRDMAVLRARQMAIRDERRRQAATRPPFPFCPDYLATLEDAQAVDDVLQDWLHRLAQQHNQLGDGDTNDEALYEKKLKMQRRLEEFCEAVQTLHPLAAEEEGATRGIGGGGSGSATEKKKPRPLTQPPLLLPSSFLQRKSSFASFGALRRTSLLDQLPSGLTKGNWMRDYIQ